MTVNGLAEGVFPEYADKKDKRNEGKRNSMIPAFFRPIVQAMHNNRDYRFWACQLTGWGGYSLATFLSVTLVDDMVSWPHVGHIVLSAVLGLLTTWPLRFLYRRTFTLSIFQRIVVASAAVLVLAALWNVLRVLVFALFVGEQAVWNEFHYWYFGSLSVFLSWTVLYYGIKYYELFALEHQKLLEESALKREEQLKRLQAESSAREAQLQMLRYQLNPHFLFNTLNAINALVKLDEPKRAGEMIQLLSQFLRHTLEQDSVETVPLEQELETLKMYLNIEKARFEDRLTLEFDIDSEAMQSRVPAMILQPIIENAMKYAVAAREEGGTVRVSARVHNEKLQLEVSDTGPGMKSTQNTEGWGLGLRNTVERLEALYGRNFTFETLQRSPSGLTVRIGFPFSIDLQRGKALSELPSVNQCAG